MYAKLVGTCALANGMIPRGSIRLSWGVVSGKVAVPEKWDQDEYRQLLKFGLVFIEDGLRPADWYAALSFELDDEQMLLALVDTDGRECATLIVDNTDEALQRIEDRLARKIEGFDIELPS